MNIAYLNERIMIQKGVLIMDAVGNHMNTWKDYFTCHATVTGTASGASGGTQQEIAGQAVDISDLAFTVRWCEKTASVNNTEYRVLFRGDLYDILSVDYMNYRKKSIKFRCRKVRR